MPNLQMTMNDAVYKTIYKIVQNKMTVVIEVVKFLHFNDSLKCDCLVLSLFKKFTSVIHSPFMY